MSDQDMADLRRYRWLRERLFGADFDYQGEGESVIVFTWPFNAGISADLDASIDAAIKEQTQ